MSQRQKKKASQGKKRYYEAAKKHESHSKPSQNSQKQNESKAVPASAPNQPSIPKNQSPSPRKPDIDGHSQQKSYSRRKITSNWSRYDEGDAVDRMGDHGRTAAETEEELQQRLMQLFNLPTQSVSTPLTDEFSPPDINKETPSFITLDCNSLAECIASIPVHDRLKLSPQLLELGGYSTQQNHNGELREQDIVRTPSENLTPLLKLSQGQTVSHSHAREDLFEGGVQHQSSATEAPVGITVPEQTWQQRLNFKPPDAPTSTAVHVSTNKEAGDGEDSELDELLSEPATTMAEEGSVTVQGEGSHSSVTTVTQETDQDELDDMLDELLA